MLGECTGAVAAAPSLEAEPAAPGDGAAPAAGAALAEVAALAEAAADGSPEPSKNWPGMTSVGAPGSDE